MGDRFKENILCLLKHEYAWNFHVSDHRNSIDKMSHESLVTWVLQTVSVLCLLLYLSLLHKQQVCETVIYLRVSSRIQLSTDDNRVLMIRKCSKARWLASRFCKMWSFLSYRQCFPIFYSIWAVKDAGCLHDTVAAHFCLVYQTGSLCCLSCQHSGKDSQGVSVICCAFNFTTLARNN